MRIIFVLPLCLAFLQATKGHTVADETQESRLSSLQDDLLQSCKANEQFCTENNKLLRNHIELLTNSMEEMTINSCGRVYDQVQELLKKENEFQKQLESKNIEIRQLEKNMTKLQLENMNYKSKEDSMAAVQGELKKQIENENYKSKEFQKQLESKNVEIRQLEKNMTKLQLENENYKSKETGKLEDLKQKMNEQLQLSNNLCEREKEEFKARKTELQREMQSKNDQIRQLGESMTKLQIENVNYKSKEDSVAAVQEELKKQIENENYKSKEFQKQLESKNVEIRQLENNMIKLQLENQNYKSKEDSMAAVQEELKNQQVIIEQLAMNQCEKENTEIAQIKKQLRSEGEKLAECNTELESKRNELVEIDEEKTKLQIELWKSIDKLEKRNPASCIDRDTSGVQRITLCTPYTFDVLCNADIAGPGWTVIQQRIRGGVNFKKNWSTYQKGFGNFWDGDFFLGLDKIHRLTAEQPHELHIEMTRFNGSTYFARFNEFAISGEEDNYRMTKLGKFHGTTTDELDYHKNMVFSTYDRDNDQDDSVNCAKMYEGGWWYNECVGSNLNGVYYGEEVKEENGIYWEDFTALKQVRMMIRPIEN